MKTFEHEYSSIHIIQDNIDVDVMCIANRGSVKDYLILALSIERTRDQLPEMWAHCVENN